ncbi:MAG: hypothetical protein ACOY3P_18435 [Planctomycetota bacterium]
MKIQQFLDHHGVATNPFTDEDAQTDLVFKTSCIHNVRHPAWDKIYGDPSEPATAVVFGEKGSGKTAIRLQVVRHLADYNAEHPDAQVFVVQYDDFNPFLDRFRERFGGRKRRPDRALAQWRLWDHMDAILSLAVTQLVDRALGVRSARHPAASDMPLKLDRLSAAERRDLLLLTACYDQSTAENLGQRWGLVRRKLGVRIWRSYWDLALGVAVTIAVVVALITWGDLNWLRRAWPYLAVLAGWLPALWRRLKWHYTAWRIHRNTSVLQHATSLLRRVLLKFPGARLVDQPLPTQKRTDDRYELLQKLQGILNTLGFTGMVVLVDRVDEPYLINGSTELMRLLVWPLLDNKFLKHPGLGIKLLLPAELERLLDRENADFQQRARLDKQNLVRSLPWTGQSLYDVAGARLKACAKPGESPSLAAFFDDSVDKRRLLDAFATLRVPRNLSKFMYRLLAAHCNAHSDDQPVWKIGSGTFESVLALYQRDQDAFDRGVGAG